MKSLGPGHTNYAKDLDEIRQQQGEIQLFAIIPPQIVTQIKSQH